MRVNLLWLLLGVFLFTSCAEIGIVKRKHRPGFHVDFGGNPDYVSKSLDEGQPREKLEVQYLDSRKPELVARQFEEQLEQRQKAKISAAFSKELRLTNSNLSPSRSSKKQNKLVREGKKKKPKGSILDWSVMAIAALCIGFLALILAIASLALLIHGATIGGDEGWNFQNIGFILALIVHFISVLAVVFGFVSKKDLKSRSLRGKGLANLAWILGVVTFLLSIVPAMMYLVTLWGTF